MHSLIVHFNCGDSTIAFAQSSAFVDVFLVDWFRSKFFFVGRCFAQNFYRKYLFCPNANFKKILHHSYLNGVSKVGRFQKNSIPSRAGSLGADCAPCDISLDKLAILLRMRFWNPKLESRYKSLVKYGLCY